MEDTSVKLKKYVKILNTNLKIIIILYLEGRNMCIYICKTILNFFFFFSFLRDLIIILLRISNFLCIYHIMYICT